MSCCHDELVVECPEDQALEVATFAGEVMVVGMDRAVNQRLAANHHERLTVDVEVEILQRRGVG